MQPGAAVQMDPRARLAFAALGTGLLAVFLAGLVFLGATPVEKLTLAVVFCGGMSMLFTP
ncbi:MAG: hypothetical protein HY613_07905 [Candidatus Rokubacteria bacterium]|nr:hypothetical protein [Candidatus Rokubacteria bacterium]